MATSDSIVKILKSTVPGRRPTNDPALAGQPYVNYADKEFGVIDTTGNPVDLLALRHWTANAAYKVNDLVTYSGNTYKAKGAVPPGAWNANKWDNIVSSDISVINNTADIAKVNGIKVFTVSAITDITLTLDDMKYGVFKFEGTTKGKVNVTIPAGSSKKLVIINTSLADITFKQGSSTKTRIIAAGTDDIIICNGVALVNDIRLVKVLDHNVAITVGPTGDFKTINAVIAHFSNFQPNTNVDHGRKGVSITLQSNYIMKEQLLVTGVNLSWITIDSAKPDKIHPCYWTAMTTLLYLGPGGGDWATPAIGVSNGGVSPFLNFYIRMVTDPNPKPGMGAGGEYTSAKGATAVGPYPFAADAYRGGIDVENGGLVIGYDFGCYDGGANFGAIGAYSGSKIIANTIHGHCVGSDGLYVSQSEVHCNEIDVSDSGTGIFLTRGSTISTAAPSGYAIKATGCANVGIHASTGSILSCGGAIDVSGYKAGGLGINMTGGSNISTQAKIANAGINAQKTPGVDNPTHDVKLATGSSIMNQFPLKGGCNVARGGPWNAQGYINK